MLFLKVFNKSKLIYCTALEDTANKRLGLPYLGKHSGWNETDTKKLTVTWDSTKLTYDINAKVKVELIGYIETDTEVHDFINYNYICV